jgi:trimethylamine:corrinoid methyltransferase-like protein
MTFYYPQMVMGADVAGLPRYWLGGVAVNDMPMSLDVLHEGGPFRQFLSHEDTRRHTRFRSPPRLIDRRVREWRAAGAGRIAARARTPGPKAPRRDVTTHND